MKILNPGSQQDDVRIELIPLIDVIFCILTFFILAAVSLTRQFAINTDLPRASTGVAQMRQTKIVTIDPVGTLYWDEDPVDESRLVQLVQQFQQESPDGTIVLNAPPYASYDSVVRVLDLLRAVGGDRVALAVTPSTQEPTDQFAPGQPGFSTPGGAPGLNNPGLNNPSLNNPGLNNPGLGNPGTPLDPFGLPTVPGDPLGTPAAPLPRTNGGSSAQPGGAGAGQTTPRTPTLPPAGQP
ncbi:biopolymer transporter ExbD [Thermoleptolyngbya sp. M55_K2018_002]|uniref:ExbD/TolR family protein n=1 Tax=Thermoleptolyngbya sp. M55_K2018_002 TaxID=2747808 RepID=UPI001A03C808|nr:biopolymer transporter ExbD [Thermoleptolyngbya sp. M55_K2018_002]HIK39657.1 biopolymer transporter ExbD [Thermoleptolyngbya sp. M55_K2018_002]